MLEYVLVLVLGIVAYIYFKRPFTYWKEKGVPQFSASETFTGFFELFKRSAPLIELIGKGYYKFKDKRYVGGYNFTYYALQLNDPELIKEVTIKHFDHFTDHNNVFPVDYEPLWNSNLFLLKGEKWRKMRSLMSPAFTGSKMRNMFVLIDKSAQQFVNFFLEKNEKVTSVELKDAGTRFANDVIANASFGIECDSLKDSENDFYKMGRELTDFQSGFKLFITVIFLMIPKLFDLFKLTLMPDHIKNFFVKIVSENIASREKHGIVRPDMIHLLMEARKTLKQEQETNPKAASEDEITEITDQDITAQALIFFFAGFETVSTLMAFMGHELAANPEVQERLQAEIDAVSGTLQDGQLTYDKLSEMKYLDMVVSEALRKWPNVGALDRVCKKNFVIEPKNPGEVAVEVEAGTVLMVPTYAIHRDEKYYPEPEKFDPERFSDENKGRIQAGTYLPFGSGPRNCIGSRFALMETKALFFHILLNFNIVPVEKTEIPLKLSKTSLSLTTDNGFWVGLERRKSSKL